MKEALKLSDRLFIHRYYKLEAFHAAMAILKQIKIQTPVQRTNRIMLLPLQSREPQLQSNGKPFKDMTFLMLTLLNFQMKERTFPLVAAVTVMISNKKSKD